MCVSAHALVTCVAMCHGCINYCSAPECQSAVASPGHLYCTALTHIHTDQHTQRESEKITEDKTYSFVSLHHNAIICMHTTNSTCITRVVSKPTINMLNTFVLLRMYL